MSTRGISPRRKAGTRGAWVPAGEIRYRARSRRRAGRIRIRAGGTSRLGAVDVVLDVADDVIGDADHVVAGGGGDGADVGGVARFGDEGDNEAARIGLDLALDAGGHDGGEDVDDGGELGAVDDGVGVGFEVGFDLGEVGFDLGDFGGGGADFGGDGGIVEDGGAEAF